jgi:hypothetical protein
MNQDETFTVKSIKCIYLAQTLIYNTEYIYFSSYKVQTLYIHEHTICMHVSVHTCSDHLYTMFIHGMYKVMLLNKKYKKQKFAYVSVWLYNHVHTSKLPKHYATRAIVWFTIVTEYVLCLTWRLVTYVRRRTSSTDKRYRKLLRFTGKLPSVQLCFRTWNPRCWGHVPTL